MEVVKSGAIKVDGKFYGSAWLRPIPLWLVEDLTELGWCYEGRPWLDGFGYVDCFSWEEPHDDEFKASVDGAWLRSALETAVSDYAIRKRAWWRGRHRVQSPPERKRPGWMKKVDAEWRGINARKFARSSQHHWSQGELGRNDPIPARPKTRFS